MFCKICEEETESFKSKIILGDYDPPRRVGIDLRYKTNVEICSKCGMIKLLGADYFFLQGLEKGYEVVDPWMINVKDIIEEMEIPLIHSEEKKIWVEGSIFKPYLMDDLSNGVTFDHTNYYRLIHFLLLPAEERIRCFGRCKTPVIEASNDSVYFIDGRRRFSLLHYLGAKKIPVAIKNLKEMTLPYYLSGGEDRI